MTPASCKDHRAILEQMYLKGEPKIVVSLPNCGVTSTVLARDFDRVTP
jgi:hypothetical protein